MSTVLCPIDFSESADEAANLAVKVAIARGCGLTLLHVDPPLRSMTRSPAANAFADARRSHEEWLEARLETARKKLSDETSVAAITRMTQRDPAEGIIEVATELDASFIVIASHGSGLRRLLLGSVAHKVVRDARCPVLLIRGGTSAALPFERPLICVDFSALSEPTARTAIDLGGAGARPELLHVVDEPGIAAMQVSIGQRKEVLELLDVLHREARGDLERFAAKLPLEGPSPTLSVKGGSVAGTILSHAAEVGASLIALGSHRPDTMRQRVLGTVADRIIRHAEVPVLLCPR